MLKEHQSVVEFFFYWSADKKGIRFIDASLCLLIQTLENKIWKVELIYCVEKENFTVSPV